MGMGIMELGVVFLIAFLVLGPSRSIDTARTAGKIIGDLRRTMNQVMEAVNLEQELGKGPSGRVPVDHSEDPSGPNANPNASQGDEPTPDKQPPDQKPPSEKE